MNQTITHKGTVLLLLAAIPLALALAGCAGADGAQGPPGQDLSQKTAEQHGSFLTTVQPLFLENDVFFDGSLGCIKCHFGDGTTGSFHGISFSSYTGFLLGPTDADPLGEDLWGRPATCADLTSVAAIDNCTPAWADSAMEGRLRNTRMPPGWDFDLDQGNRDTPEIQTIYGWLRDGGLDSTLSGSVTYQTLLTDLRLDSGDGGIREVNATPVGVFSAVTWTSATPSTTVGDLFKDDGQFFLGSQACTDCHNSDANTSFSWHYLNLTSYAGILKGPQDDGLPYIEDILGRDLVTCADPTGVVGAGCVPVADEAGLYARLNDTRMPPGWPFQLSLTNRDMWAIQQIGYWVDAGMPNGAY